MKIIPTTALLACSLLVAPSNLMAADNDHWTYKHVMLISLLVQNALETDPVLAPSFAKYPLCAAEPDHLDGDRFSGKTTCYTHYDETKPETNVELVTATYSGTIVRNEPSMKLPDPNNPYCTEPVYSQSIYGLSVKIRCNDTYVNDKLTQTSTTYTFTVAAPMPEVPAKVDIEKLYWAQDDLIIIDDTAK